MSEWDLVQNQGVIVLYLQVSDDDVRYIDDTKADADKG